MGEEGGHCLPIRGFAAGIPPAPLFQRGVWDGSLRLARARTHAFLPGGKWATKRTRFASRVRGRTPVALRRRAEAPARSQLPPL